MSFCAGLILGGPGHRDPTLNEGMWRTARFDGGDPTPRRIDEGTIC